MPRGRPLALLAILASAACAPSRAPVSDLGRRGAPLEVARPAARADARKATSEIDLDEGPSSPINDPRLLYAALGVPEKPAPRAIPLLVADRVVVECKATVAYNSLFEAQALTYLRLCGLRLALVINFGERQVRQGIHRVVNGLQR